MSIQERTVPPKRLAQNLTSAGVSLYLSDINDWDNTASSTKLLSASDFGTLLYALLRNEARTQIEIVELDPSTITVATSPITINKRALGYNGGTTADIETAYDWLANETIVELGSDVPQLLSNYVNITDAQTIVGVKIFSNQAVFSTGASMGDAIIEDVATPVVSTDAANKQFVVDTAAGVGVSYDSIVIPAVAGETITIGQLVYFSDTDNEWMKCDADTAGTVDNVLLGIAQGAGSNGVAITGGVLRTGLDANQSGLTIGAPYYASNTAGGISATPGTTEVFVGFAYSATQLYFDPRAAQQITENEQDALVGNGGTPSSSNLLVTQQGYQEGSEAYGEDAEGDDTYVIALSPAITSYTDGMVVRFEATTANTGACTLDAGGGVQSIKKYGDAGIQELDNNDIQAGEVVTLVYSVATTDWILQGAPKIAVADAVDLTDAGTTLLHTHPITSGYATKVVNNTDDQTIAHGLGVIPKLVKITCMAYVDTNVNGMSVGTGTATNAERVLNTNCTAGTGDKTWSDETAIIWGHDNDGNVEFKANLKTLDATNIVLEWTANTSAGLTRVFIWEAYA